MSENKKKKKVVRNKARDVLGDYWKVNRDINRQDREATKDQKGQPLRGNEKIYVTVIVVGLILIILRYFVFKI